jgi:hypothetical protein
MTFYEIFAAHYTKPIPEGDPDPYIGNGWQSIDRFFGHGTTWTSTLPQLADMKASIEGIVSDPKGHRVESVSLHFSRLVSNLSAQDFRLERDGMKVPLTNVTLLSSDNIHWMLSGLAPLTDVRGEYLLTLLPGVHASDSFGTFLATGVSFGWSSHKPSVITLKLSQAPYLDEGFNLFLNVFRMMQSLHLAECSFLREAAI